MIWVFATVVPGIVVPSKYLTHSSGLGPYCEILALVLVNGNFICLAVINHIMLISAPLSWKVGTTFSFSTTLT